MGCIETGGAFSKAFSTAFSRVMLVCDPFHANHSEITTLTRHGLVTPLTRSAGPTRLTHDREIRTLTTNTESEQQP